MTMFIDSRFLFWFDCCGQRKGPELVSMKFCLFKWFNGTEGDSLMVRFQHNLFALSLPEVEHFHEGSYDMVCRISVIVVQ
jgi:hypothetical protein